MEGKRGGGGVSEFISEFTLTLKPLENFNPHDDL